MSPNKLAHKLLQFRSSTSLMMPGQLQAEIGSEGLQDALQRAWLVPDMETGFLSLTDQATQLHEMRELAETPDVEEKTAKAPQNESRAAAMNHSSRLVEYLPLGLSGSDTSGGAPGSGQPERPPTSTMPPTPTAPTNPSQDYAVGQDVIVASEGKAYQAKVQSKNGDGTYRLSFGPNKPTQADRAYRKQEIQTVDKGTQGNKEVKVQ